MGSRLDRLVILRTVPVIMTEEKLRIELFTPRLLAWYARAARELPWRIGPAERAAGVKADPYRVWLAEIMLQQTTVAHAIPYYQAFLERWPDVAALAAAEDAEVMAAWAGLGYYARARNLLKCARLVVALDGRWPQTQAELQHLPGIGPYTAGAVAALAFDQPAVAMDGNVERVFARLLMLDGAWTEQKKTIRQAVERLVPPQHPAEFAEALMDLGATVCTPKTPSCNLCPLAEFCASGASGQAERYPIKPPKAPKDQRQGHVYIAIDPQGRIRTERRPARGLLGGMLGLPTSDWVSQRCPAAEFPWAGEWQSTAEIRHVFTHFALRLQVWFIRLETEQPDWLSRDEAMRALPSVFRKALKSALQAVDNSN